MSSSDLEREQSQGGRGRQGYTNGVGAGEQLI